MSWNPEAPIARALAVLVAAPNADDARLREALGDDRDAGAGEILQAARARFAQGDAHWFPCAGDACRAARAGVATGADPPYVVSETTCQGPCDHAPVGVFRVGDRVETLRGFDAASDAFDAWLRSAALAGHLWTESAARVAHRFDPVHGAGDTALDPFGFLVGHFRGEGEYATHDGTFWKEVLGAWEANGRVLSLRMAVSFPLRDGRRDSHEALVVVSEEEDAICGRGYEDSGALREYQFDVRSDGSLWFADRPPGHGHSARRARKGLVPTEHGYREVLQVEREDGAFDEYSRIEMLRV